MSSPQASTPVAVPASLMRRLAAAGYDLLPLAAMWMGGTALLLPFTGDRGIAPHTPAYQLYLALITLGYYTLSWKRGGQTIGMRAWRIRVVASDGDPLDWRRVALRFAVAFVSVAALGVGVFACLFDARRRMWHDRAARTEVVVVPKRPR